MEKILTSFGNITTAEGERITYTYTEINENGDIVKEDGKGVYIERDKEFLDMIRQLKAHVEEHMKNIPEPNTEPKESTFEIK